MTELNLDTAQNIITRYFWEVTTYRFGSKVSLNDSIITTDKDLAIFKVPYPTNDSGFMVEVNPENEGELWVTAIHYGHIYGATHKVTTADQLETICNSEIVDMPTLLL